MIFLNSAVQNPIKLGNPYICYISSFSEERVLMPYMCTETNVLLGRKYWVQNFTDTILVMVLIAGLITVAVDLVDRVFEIIIIKHDQFQNSVVVGH